MTDGVTYGPMVIWRFDVAFSSPVEDIATELQLPLSAHVIHAGIDGRTPYRHVSIWVLLPVDDEGNACAPQPRKFWVHLTGRTVPSKRRHVGSAFDPPAGDVSPAVLHVFEEARW